MIMDHCPKTDIPLVGRILELSQRLEPIPTDEPLRLDPIDGIETVLFDVYGTLLISGSGDVGTAAATDCAVALAEALACSGLSGKLVEAGKRGTRMLRDEIQEEHKRTRKAGIDFPEVEIREIWMRILRALQTDALLDQQPNEETVRRLALEYECRVNPVWTMPGAKWTLTTLHQRGWKLGIVSNAQFYTPLLLETLLGASLTDIGFDPALCAWSFEERQAKPSVDLFARLPIDPACTLYVGNDLLNDVWAASRVGCRTVLFAGDQRSLRRRQDDPRCVDLQPDAVVDDLRQIPELL